MVKPNQKIRVAVLSVLSNTTLIILKVIAGVISGSVSIISEAIHSGMDLIAALIALFSVRFSSKPADTEHPYGHGKIENISGVIEGLLIFIAAYLIIAEAIKKFSHPTAIEGTFIGIGVMLFSAIVNTLVARQLYKVARAEDSMALEADALHLKTDVYTSIGVAAGLILIKLTGIMILDPIVAILVAMLIIKESWVLVRTAFSPLLDVKLSEEDEKRIRETLARYETGTVSFHNLRTRKAGHIRYIDFHMNVYGSYTVKESHDLCEVIEAELEAVLAHTNVNIHVEPDGYDSNRQSQKKPVSSA